MKFSDLIDRLLEIQNKYDCDDVETHLMSEVLLPSGALVVEHRINDVAVCVGKNGVKEIIIIGQELD